MKRETFVKSLLALVRSGDVPPLQPVHIAALALRFQPEKLEVGTALNTFVPEVGAVDLLIGDDELIPLDGRVIRRKQHPVLFAKIDRAFKVNIGPAYQVQDCRQKKEASQ